ncbi:hypothetical protein [Kineococcus rhizosphaerae]|uniref:Luciferase-like monooxygenase n=1 Tax=Kineococcus rhizosphaerae TaxID=559628 RepID=A0A2T0RAM4_9ACTN|nr:hypothetical protein [Kineococcus rhizosphaerae]PRY18181.1 hypothetical protein CLV37_101425 [Kineococcus rhizosphaerae]
MTPIGRERGSPSPGPGQFDAQTGPDGAFVVGAPDTVAAKPARFSDQLGGIDRISLQMADPLTSHAELVRSSELLGDDVVPRLTGL